MTKKMISLEVSEELKEALRVEAFNRAVSVSALIRQILEESLISSKESERKWVSASQINFLL